MKTKKIIDSATIDFLGKLGVIGISEEKKNLIFYVDLNRLLYDKIPVKYKGLNVFIKGINEIKAL
jgi:hypothetical protein